MYLLYMINKKKEKSVTKSKRYLKISFAFRYIFLFFFLFMLGFCNMAHRYFTVRHFDDPCAFSCNSPSLPHFGVKTLVLEIYFSNFSHLCQDSEIWHTQTSFLGTLTTHVHFLANHHLRLILGQKRRFQKYIFQLFLVYARILKFGTQVLHCKTL